MTRDLPPGAPYLLIEVVAGLVRPGGFQGGSLRAGRSRARGAYALFLYTFSDTPDV